MVVLHANAVKLTPNSAGNVVQTVTLKSLSGKQATAKARFFVIACGGIETPRLLLASDGVEKHGLGNHNDMVGRYFQDHVQSRPAKLKLRDPTSGIASFQGFYRGAVAFSPRVVLSPQLQEKRETLNSCLGIIYSQMPDENSSVEAAKRLLRGIQRGFSISPVTDAGRVLRRPHELAAAFFRRYLKKQSAFKSFGDVCVGLQSECEPTPMSRITLGPEVDSLGMRRTRLDWRLTPLVRHTAIVAVEALDRELKRLGLGEVDRDSFDLTRSEADWQRSFWDTNHHIGTCRMSLDAHHGVVNRDCRMHTVENLYLSSSAVFPTSGYSNPTFTIIALAIRLADHLKALA